MNITPLRSLKNMGSKGKQIQLINTKPIKRQSRTASIERKLNNRLWQYDLGKSIWAFEVGIIIKTGRSVGYENDIAEGFRLDCLQLYTDGKKEGRIVIYEIKSCREDYVSDKKWHHYLKACHQFYWVVDRRFPEDILDTSSGAGVIVGDYIRKRAKVRKCDRSFDDMHRMIVRRMHYKINQYCHSDEQLKWWE